MAAAWCMGIGAEAVCVSVFRERSQERGREQPHEDWWWGWFLGKLVTLGELSE